MLRTGPRRANDATDTLCSASESEGDSVRQVTKFGTKGDRKNESNVFTGRCFCRGWYWF